MGSAGPGTTLHMSGEWFKLATGVQSVHVPFKGTVPQMLGIMTNQVQFGFASIPTTMTQVKAGKLRAIAQGGPGGLVV